METAIISDVHPSTDERGRLSNRWFKPLREETTGGGQVGSQRRALRTNGHWPSVTASVAPFSRDPPAMFERTAFGLMDLRTVSQ